MLEVRLFGSGRLSYTGRPLVGFPDHQFYAVFCYLILYRQQSHPREKLASTFWTDYPISVSRKYLRDALWRLRQGLESVGVPSHEYLAVGDSQVAFLGSGAVWLDVDIFERALSKLRSVPGADLNEEQVKQMEQAVDLYCGDLLEGVYHDWCLNERERLHLLYLSALARLMNYHEAHGGYEQAIQYGERILASDSTREMTHRQMMRLYWRLGDRDAAVAQYRRCAQTLRETLGIQPMDETRALYTQIMSDSLTGLSPSLLLAPMAGMVTDPGALAEHALQRVRHARARLDETREELDALERALSSLLRPPSSV
jgi:DNA-binding SARP family transcriptional activator